MRRYKPEGGQDLDLGLGLGLGSGLGDIANWTPTTLFSETYTTDGWERDLNGGDGGGGFGNGNGYTDTNGAGDYGFDSQGGGAGAAGGGSQYEYQPSQHSSYSTNRYQGNGFKTASPADGCSEYNDFSVRIVFGKVVVDQQDRDSRHNALVLNVLLALLSLLALSIFALGVSSTWPLLLTQVQQAISRLATTFHSHVQLFGFFTMLCSAGTCLSVKTLAAQRSRLRTRCDRYQRYTGCDEKSGMRIGRRGGRRHADFMLGGGFS